MRRRLLAAAVAFGGLALAAGAVPAFTEESGTVTMKITAAPPAAPCVLVSPNSLDFGTLPFSNSTAISFASRTLTIRSCATGTTKEKVVVAGTDAVGPSGARWILPTSGARIGCPVDVYTMLLLLGSGPPFTVIEAIETSPKDIVNRSTLTAYEWSPDQSQDFELRVEMPCEGSNGAGETKSLSVTLTAVVV
jgi:hypothetical protein